MAVALCMAATAAAPLAAQQPPSAPPIRIDDTLPRLQAAPPPPAPKGVSPRGAFLRAMAIPGWGHAAIGSYRRGAFYFVVEGITAWQLLKIRRGIQEADRQVDFRESILLGDLSAAGVTDPDTIQAALDADDTLTDLLGLQSARKGQKEDWTALGIFLVFLSGADAYVSAHLEHFPAPLTLNAQPAGNGRMDLSVGIKLPGRSP